jgi:hypothetical protein
MSAGNKFEVLGRIKKLTLETRFLTQSNERIGPGYDEWHTGALPVYHIEIERKEEPNVSLSVVFNAFANLKHGDLVRVNLYPDAPNIAERIQVLNHEGEVVEEYKVGKGYNLENKFRSGFEFKKAGALD